MKVISRTVNLREDQDKALLNIAAQKQIETGDTVGRSEIIRDQLDIALRLPKLKPIAQAYLRDQLTATEAADKLAEEILTKKV